MAEINLVIGIRAPADQVYKALTSNEGLAKWWTSETSGDPAHEGGVIAFRFDGHGPDMEVTRLQPGSGVEWHCVSHPAAEWVGTRFSFALREEKGQVIMRFRHYDWADATDFLAFCSMKWATFLISLREYVETGKGLPFPDDVQIT